MDRNEWSEAASAQFLDYGRFFVPARETQIQTICALIPPQVVPFTVWELACGEGLLAEAILQQHAHSHVIGYDGSATMRSKAQERLAAYGHRFQPRPFDLFAADWRQTETAVHAVVSSLAIHHLDDTQKQHLYNDLYDLLAPHGALIVADLVQPTSAYGTAVAVHAWDEAVRQRSLELTGNDDAFTAFVHEKWNLYRYPDPMDKPSSLFDQLQWLAYAGFTGVDVFWMQAGHVIFGGYKS